MIWATQAAVNTDRTLSAEDRQSGSVRLPEPGSADRSHEVVRAIGDLRRGDVVLLRDKNTTALLLAAEMVSDESLARARRIASLNGQFPISPPLLATTRRRAEALGLILPDDRAESDDTTFVELRLSHEVAADTVRELADPTLTLAPEDRTFVLSVAGRAGIAAAATELAKLARLLPAVVVLPNLSREAALAAERGGIIAIGATQALRHRRDLAHDLRRVADARVPLADSHETRIVAFRPADGGTDHLAIVVGNPVPGEPVLTRIHSECFTGDLLGSLRCDCGEQLRGAIRAMAEAGSGIVLYLAQEGRGIGLVNKLRAYTLQDAGFDTVDANMQLGFESDERIYQPAAAMLRDLGFGAVKLMTNNPLKLKALAQQGIEIVERVAHSFPSNKHNHAYLETKARRSGHLF
jgi:GTP cyclohydrolase II